MQALSWALPSHSPPHRAPAALPSVGTAAEQAWAPAQKPGTGTCKLPPYRLKSTHACQRNQGPRRTEPRRGRSFLSRGQTGQRAAALAAVTRQSTGHHQGLSSGTANRGPIRRPSMLSCLGSRRAGRNTGLETSLAIQWLRFCAPKAGPGPIPAQGARSHTPQLKTLHAATRTKDPTGHNQDPSTSK